MSDPRVGRTTDPFEVEFDAFRNTYYLQATHEDQGVFCDPEAAKAAGLPGVAAPPTRFFGPTTPGFPEPTEFMCLSVDKALMTGARYEFTRLPLLGEKFIGRGCISSVTEKPTKGGTMTFVVLTITYSEPDGTQVATEELTFAQRP